MEIENANSHPFKVAITSEGDEMYANSHPYKVSVVEGGNELVSELPETGSKGTTYVLVDDVENPSKVYGTYLYDGNEWLLVAQPVDQAVEMVEELPEEGKEGVLYYVPKTGTDTYDLYRWIKVDTDITLYDQEGNNTDGAMTQAATTAMKGMAKELTSADYNWPTNNPDGVAVWLLNPGFYRTNRGVKIYWMSSSQGTSAAPFEFIVAKQGNSGDVAINIIPDTLIMDRSDGTNLLETTYVKSSQVVDNLTSTLTGSPLSANQGRVLKDLIDSNLGKARTLTTADYNYHRSGSTDDGIAFWLLSPGFYTLGENLKIYFSTTTNNTEFSGFTFIVTRSSINGIVYTLFPDKTTRGAFKIQYSDINGENSNVSTVVMQTDIRDNLTSNDSYRPLSAKQGKVLNEKIGDLANLTTTDKTNLVAAIDELVTNSPNVVSSQDWSNLWQ